jgi:hypothetical protein
MIINILDINTKQEVDIYNPKMINSCCGIGIGINNQRISFKIFKKQAEGYYQGIIYNKGDK